MNIWLQSFIFLAFNLGSLLVQYLHANRGGSNWYCPHGVEMRIGLEGLHWKASHHFTFRRGVTDVDTIPS